MYSVVLVVALAGSAEAPDCHRSHGCQGGCYGGCSGSYGGCSGSYGGCYGASYGGCYGGGYGGCMGGYGGCYGGGYGGCSGSPYGGCYGGGYGGCYGGIPYGGGVKTIEKVKEMPSIDKKDGPIAAPANIVVNLPSGAKLSIDGFVSSQSSATRYLVTPTLQPGQDYTYTLVAETVQNGQPVQQTQKITVRAGATTPVSFSFNGTPVAASR